MKQIFLGLIGLLYLQLTAQTSTDSTKVVNGINYIQHKVVSGETLYRLSKNYNTSVDNLRKVNNNLSTLKLGSTIWVPSPIVKVAATKTTSSSTYTVGSGETLYAISKKLNVPIATIKELNNLSGNDISVGQVLKVSSDIVEVAKPVKVTEKVVAVTKEPTAVSSKKPETVKTDKTIDISESTTKVTPPTNPVIKVQREDETTEQGLARVVKTANMNEERCFIKHPTVPVGNIVVVINDRTGKMAYCRVIENVSTETLKDSKIVMTKAVAEKIGLQGDSGEVTIKYATL